LTPKKDNPPPKKEKESGGKYATQGRDLGCRLVTRTLLKSSAHKLCLSSYKCLRTPFSQPTGLKANVCKSQTYINGAC